MSKIRVVTSIACIVIGVICLLVGLFSGIVVPGTDTVNLGRMHDSLKSTLWGFGLTVIGLLLRRPPVA